MLAVGSRYASSGVLRPLLPRLAGCQGVTGSPPVSCARRRSSGPGAGGAGGGYSYVVVGGGSAGCVMAARLSEDPASRVLLLEAGPRDTVLGSKRLAWKIHMPLALAYNLCDDRYNWCYNTEPQEGLGGRSLYWPRGRVLGGSSSLNAMVYIRGHAGDYDAWVVTTRTQTHVDSLTLTYNNKNNRLSPPSGGDGTTSPVPGHMHLEAT